MHRSEGKPGIGCLRKRAERRLAGLRTPVCMVAAVIPLGVQEDRGQEGHAERPKLRWRVQREWRGPMEIGRTRAGGGTWQGWRMKKRRHGDRAGMG
jgi:hypothetical protein